MVSAPTRIAIIDDVELERSVTSQEVTDMGAVPVVFQDPFGSKTAEEAAADIRLISDAAICDHRLRRAGYAQFDGAELVATLVGAGFPAILLTTFAHQDGDSSIRKWRGRIPVVLDRDNASEAAFGQAIHECQLEILGEARPERRARKTFVQVLHLRDEGSFQIVDAIVPAWNANKAVSFPLELVPDSIRSLTGENTLLTARVNLGASSADELYFEAFELAPEIDESDGLG